MPTGAESEPPGDIVPGREFPGRLVVAVVFVFAISVVAVLYVYWRLHVGPFVPLQRAILAEFPGSAPRVEGGQRKMHQGTPRVLRIVLKVGFDPRSETARGDRIVEVLADLARRHVDWESFDLLEVHLFEQVPEKSYVSRTVERDLAAERAK
jgi:hypothetical protein